MKITGYTQYETTVGELLKQEIDIDVWDDASTYEDDFEFGIAFVGPQRLTDEGLSKFQYLFDIPIDVDWERNDAVICVYERVDRGIIREEDIPSVWEDLKLLFWGAAGYIGVSKYKSWFKDGED